MNQPLVHYLLFNSTQSKLFAAKYHQYFTPLRLMKYTIFLAVINEDHCQEAGRLNLGFLAEICT